MTKLITLTKGKFAIVDDEDYDFINQWKWHIASGYATRSKYLGIINGKKMTKAIIMHREINKTPEGMDTDHINMDRLDNRKSNLRNATRSQNFMNKKSKTNSSSRFKGVFWYKKYNKWQSALKINGKIKFLGYFIDEVSAARAYNEAAVKYFGEFAQLNMIED